MSIIIFFFLKIDNNKRKRKERKKRKRKRERILKKPCLADFLFGQSKGPGRRFFGDSLLHNEIGEIKNDHRKIVI